MPEETSATAGWAARRRWNVVRGAHVAPAVVRPLPDEGGAIGDLDDALGGETGVLGLEVVHLLLQEDGPGAEGDADGELGDDEGAPHGEAAATARPAEVGPHEEGRGRAPGHAAGGVDARGEPEGDGGGGHARPGGGLRGGLGASAVPMRRLKAGVRAEARATAGGTHSSARATASRRNCRATSRPRAPSTLRAPTSRLRPA